MLEHELETALGLAREASEIVMRYYHTGAEVKWKDIDDPVTVADHAASRLLVDRLSQAFPGDAVLSEEEADDGSRLRHERVWMIDPIDGTKSFILKTPLFGTLIALERDGVPVLGSIYFAIRDQLLIGSAETGTFLNGKRCAVSTRSELAEATMIITDPRDLLPHPAHRLVIDLAREVRLVRGFGDCYGYFLVATGLADLMIEPKNLQYYDVAPMAPILAGAGGVFSSLRGDLDFATGEGLAANPTLHRQIVERARQYGEA